MLDVVRHPAALARLEAALKSALESSQIVCDPGLAAAHAGDWSEAPRKTPALVAYPRTPRQVAEVLRICSEYGQQVVVQGGLTGLAGGANPMASEIVVSLARLNAVEELDTVGGTVLAQAGVILEELAAQVEAAGWYFPLDLGARGSCQIGGNAATNAGGNRVIRFGTMRELVLGLEVALPDGRLLTMLNRVTKNTTGIDLKHLFIGAEGTLGVITRLVLKLSPLPTASTTALCALPSFDAATQLVRELRRALPSLSAFELMWADYLETGAQVCGLRLPFDAAHPIYVLLETLGTDEEAERIALESRLGAALETGMVSDVIVAQSMDDARRLWAYRESIGELLGHLKPFAAFDVGIPMAAMDAFVESVGDELDRRFPNQRHLFFGHIGDGNLHVLSGPHMAPESLHEVERVVYAATGRAGGSISAEHGIGVVKKEFLHWSRSDEELALMRSLKALLDPQGILNAERVLPHEPT
ncbi:MAG: FAD-binding oxidoreductase [Proteobacteria bacterium]|nr:FAD-binding oxidoreductase [Pseudomonadota bacterium]